MRAAMSYQAVPQTLRSPTVALDLHIERPLIVDSRHENWSVSAKLGFRR